MRTEFTLFFFHNCTHCLLTQGPHIISSWTHPQCDHSGLWSWCAGLGHEVPRSGAASCGPESSSVVPGLQSLLSRPLARTWLYFLSFTSFCLFKNQSGFLYWRGVCIMVITRSTSSSVSSPALLVRSMSAFLNTTWAYLRPTPLTAVKAKAIFRRSSMLVLSTHKMCWNLGITRDRVAAPVAVCRPPVEAWTHFIFSISLWKSLSAVRILEFIYSKTLVLQARKKANKQTLGNSLARTTKPGGNSSEIRIQGICLLLKICPCPGNHLFFLSSLMTLLLFPIQVWNHQAHVVESSVVVQSLNHVQLSATQIPWPSLSPGVCSNSCLLRQWCHPTISSSVSPFSSCLQSFPASGS